MRRLTAIKRLHRNHWVLGASAKWRILENFLRSRKGLGTDVATNTPAPKGDGSEGAEAAALEPPPKVVRSAGQQHTEGG
jgi:hypothetical protein